MTEYPLQLVRKNPDATQAGKARHPLGELDSSKYARHLVLYRAELSGLDHLLGLACPHIPGMAGIESIRAVLAHNPDCVWVIARKRGFNPAAPVGEGFVAMLPLNAKGLQRLAANDFDGAQPDLGLIARPGERPAGIYMWAYYAPGPLVGGISLFMNTLATPTYDGVNFYSRPNTAAGYRFNEAIGMKKNPTIGSTVAPHLYEYTRAPQMPPLYDSHRSGAGPNCLSVSVVHSFDDLMRVASVRSAVYIGEQECPYDEEFDGNDMSATHLLGYVGDEPAGCIRIRYFADFVKIERLAVRKEFRTTRLSTQLARASIELCRMKGYRILYAHAQKRLINFYTRFGFKVLENGHEIIFSDFEYVEMVANVQPHPEAITFRTDPYKVIRPEGRWHVPGILEASAAREVSQPSIRNSVA